MYSLEDKKKKRKILEIIGVVIILLWVLLFLIDYFRYDNNKKPLIVFKTNSTKFVDGTVTEYYSLGYVYREYKRRAIGTIELAPFWQKMQRPVPIDDFPITFKGYNVPDNDSLEIKYKGLIYFYNEQDLVGTYKCLNTKTACDIAVSGEDKYNIKSFDPLNALAVAPSFYVFDQNYAFIDDSFEQPHANKVQYKRTIYLFNIKKNKIIAEYADIKYSVVNTENEFASSVDNNFIVMNKSKKWGIVNIKDGKIKEVLPFEYESINYNQNTGYYILKKNNWFIIKDLTTKEIIGDFIEPIINLYEDEERLIVQAVINPELPTFSYKVSLVDGTEILNNPDIIQLAFHSGFITYVTSDLFLTIIDYNGQKLINDKIKLYFNTFLTSEEALAAYKVELLPDVKQVYITIPRSNAITSSYDTYYYNYETWVLVSKSDS